MVCTNVTVGMPDYTSLRSSYAGSREMDFGALKYNLSLSFKETEFLTKQTYGELPETRQQTQNENPGYTPEQQSFLDQVREILGDFGPFNSNNIA